MSPNQDDPRPLGEGARQILDAARGGERLSAERKAQLRGRVMAAVGVGLGAGAAASAAEAAAAHAAAAHVGGASVAKVVGLSLFAKIGIGVAVVTLGAGGWVWSRASEHGRSGPAEMAAASARGPAASAPGGAPDEIVAPVNEVPSAPAKESEAPGVASAVGSAGGAGSAASGVGVAGAASGAAGVASVPGTTGGASAASAAGAAQVGAADSLEQETRLITAAHAALSRGNAAGALALLDEHAAKFPRGALAPERRAARAMALCKAGRAEEGRREAEALYGKGGSPLAEKIERACAK